MAIVRGYNDSDNFLSYLATVAMFCGISCTILMLKFKGFKASLNLSSGKRKGKEHFELAPQVSVNGAYRTSRQEYYANNYYLDPPKKITPSMVKLPPNAHETGIKPSKSTGDLSKVTNAPVDVRKSTPNVSASVTQASKDGKSQLKEQKKLEKERQAEQKKREKLAAQERDKQEKLRKEREKQEALQAKQAKEKEKQRKKKVAPAQPNQKAVPQQNSLFPKVHSTHSHSTNTLESSISRSSGPPPYSDTPQVILNKNDNTGNTSFAKPIESSSWDLISQHRQEMSKTTGAIGNKPKQTTLDLHYNVGNANDDKDNSEA
ncbi:uncharacterized protein [Epargyreus clarus]|uniref:uncharacterized protein n=1 Tax=Epargyreus clarus TaxID=520877 RepID=UPI003C2D3362